MTTNTRPLPERLGVAALSRLGFAGLDLAPLWDELVARIKADPADCAAMMDLSFVAQILGRKDAGHALQAEAFTNSLIYRLKPARPHHRLTLLALASPGEMGDNTPVEFLLDGSDVDLCTLYVDPDLPLPANIPPHDLAMVIAPDTRAGQKSFQKIRTMARQWPRPVINDPDHISRLNRDNLYRELAGINGLFIPVTVKTPREGLLSLPVSGILPGCDYPIIIRPLDSQAGRGLAKLHHNGDLRAYLSARGEGEFFISPFIDYRSVDGLFRKYRIVFIDGRPYACHMAIAEQWDIWYLNAHMALSAEKCAEEKSFMENFDADFAHRHKTAFEAMAARIGLDYFAVDCGELQSGKLLIFEAGNTMIVHDMDSAAIFPYKAPQMKKIFAAFVAMLHCKAGLDKPA